MAREMDDDEWVPAEALKSLQTERIVHSDETELQLSRRLMRENLPLITAGMIHTALHSQSERLRLDAQKYVMDRVLGKVGDDAFEGTVSPIDELTKALVSDTEEMLALVASGSDVDSTEASYDD